MSVEQKSIDTIRILSAEAIERAKSGHPGICMGAAPIGYELFAEHLNFNCHDPNWDNRDRFVLSAGHGSMLLYSLLHMFGYDVTKEDIINFRQLGSRTPGHPEYGKTAGVETSTGPLGQGLGNAVGLAVAEAHLAALFNRPGFPIVDHYTYVLTGDGCLEEGISYEASSFAGTQKLGKLILLYDNNDITIEGDINSTFSEDVATRFIAQGWQVLRVQDATNLYTLSNAITRAKAEKERPTIIICKTQIGYGSPLAGTADCHGAPLGEVNLQATKEKLGWTYPPFKVPEDVWEHCHAIAEEKAKKQDEWNKMFARYELAYPELATKYKMFMKGIVPDWADVQKRLPFFDKPEATRSCGGKVLNAIAQAMPNVMSGSADLGPSTKTEIKGEEYFSPEHREGCNIHFGVREHAMAAICNGIQLHGGLKAVCSTFFSFTDYMKAGIRMTALMNIPVLYVMTHDSIGVGEDGPTHQPMEQLISLRSIPNINVFRPCDGTETYAAFKCAFTDKCPTVIVESRQNLPAYDHTADGAERGAYVLSGCVGKPDVLLIASGSEIEPCMQAQRELADEGIKSKVISMVSMEKFEQQSREYRDFVIDRDVMARVCVEAASHYSWYRYSRDYGEVIAMTGFGVSGPAKQLFEHFGFTSSNIVNAAKKSMENVVLGRFSH